MTKKNKKIEGGFPDTLQEGLDGQLMVIAGIPENVKVKLAYYALCCPYCGRKSATKRAHKCHVRACPEQDKFIEFVGDFYEAFKKLLIPNKEHLDLKVFKDYIERAQILTGWGGNYMKYEQKEN